MVIRRQAAAIRREPLPVPVRLALLAFALLALASTAVALGLRVAGAAAGPAGQPVLGLSAGTSSEPVCGPIEEAPESGIIACAHADERPAGVSAEEPTLDELVARAGGPAAVDAFADPSAIDITDGPKVRGGGRTTSSTAGTSDAASAADLRADGSMSVYSTVPSGGTPGIPCIGDGKTGNRVQAMYVYPSNRPDRSGTVVPLIRSWAADVDRVVRLSAAQKTSKRHMKWVHNSSCVLTVTKVRLSRYSAGSFSRTISELAAKGYKRADRRYMIWFDGNAYCGIGRFFPDDRASKYNRNNGKPYGPASYARVDASCWGQLTRNGISVEAHEIMHTIGAVQSSAPRSTRAGHCFDEYDTMCYADGGRGPMRYVCAATQEAYLDCGKNDYFNPRPASGSYLAKKWNTARSSFMSSSAVGDPLIETASASAPTGAANQPTASVTLTWNAVLDAAQVRTRLEIASFTDAGVLGAWAPLATVDGAGTQATVNVARPTGNLAGHLVRIRAEDSGGRWSAWWVVAPIYPDRQDLPPTVTGPVATADYRDGGTQYLTVDWTVDDEGWQVTSELQESVDGGAWTAAGTYEYQGASLARPVNHTYRYQVRARDSAGQWSDWAVGPPITITDAPPTVSGLTAQATDDGADGLLIIVTWTPSDDDSVQMVEILESVNGGSHSLLADEFVWDTAYLYRPTGSTYSYRIRVTDSAGQVTTSAASNTVGPNPSP